MTLFTCANLRVFFWTPMVAAWCWQSEVAVSIMKLELFGGAVAKSSVGENGRERPTRQ
jgi:hypothetical protein